MSDPLIAEIKMFAGNFAPRGFAFCSGQILSIAQNTALFSLLGTTYGGNGQTTFGLPDLRGRCPVHVGQGPGLPSVVLGEMAGSPTTTLTPSQMPAHIHTLSSGRAKMPCSSGAGDSDNPTGAIPAGSATDENYAATGSATDVMADANLTGTTDPAGSSQPFSNMQPFLGINFIIALEGIYPSRN